MPPSKAQRTLVSKDKSLAGRDYSKYKFEGESNLNKRRTVLKVVAFVLQSGRATVDELNAFSRQHHFTPSTRPLIREVTQIPENLKNRYSIKSAEVIMVGKKTLAVYNQFGGELFDDLCEKFNHQYHLKIEKVQ